MIVNIAIKGGLGNQLFQFAYGEFLKKEYGSIIKYDLKPLSFNEENLTNRDFELLPLNIHFEQTSLFIHRIVYTSNETLLFRAIAKLSRAAVNLIYVEEKNWMTVTIAKNHNYYLNGYWQNSKYAMFLNNYLKNIPDLKINQEYLKLIQSSHHNIGIHIRRGDYVNNSKINKYHGNCELEYFYRSIELIKQRKTIDFLFVFSDDINWVKNNFQHHLKAFFIEPDLNSPLSDLMLLKSCKNLILSNSSFSAWASYLIEEQNAIIVAPKHWTRNTETDKLPIKTEKWTII
jgi:hypothetical protein